MCVASDVEDQRPLHRVTIIGMHLTFQENIAGQVLQTNFWTKETKIRGTKLSIAQANQRQKHEIANL